MTLSPASTRARRRRARRCAVEGGVAEAELVELGPLQEEVQVVLPREADAAVHLERRRHHPLDASEHQIFAVDAATDASGSSAPSAPGRPVDGRAHALDVDEHVGAAVLHRLEAADRPAELHAVLGVLDRQVERAGRARRASRPRERSRPGRASASTRVRAAEAHAPARASSSSQPSSRVRSIAGSRRGATHRVEVDGEQRRPSASGDDDRDVGRRRVRHGSGRPVSVQPSPAASAAHRVRSRLHATHADLAAREPLHELGRRRAASGVEREHGRQERRRRDVPADLLEQHRDLDRSPSPRPPSLLGQPRRRASPARPWPSQSVAVEPAAAVDRRRGRAPARPARRAASRAPSRSATWSSERSKSIGRGTRI